MSTLRYPKITGIVGKLSDLEVDCDKDWGGHRIGNLVIGKTEGVPSEPTAEFSMSINSGTSYNASPSSEVSVTSSYVQLRTGYVGTNTRVSYALTENCNYFKIPQVVMVQNYGQSGMFLQNTIYDDDPSCRGIGIGCLWDSQCLALVYNDGGSFEALSLIDSSATSYTDLEFIYRPATHEAMIASGGIVLIEYDLTNALGLATIRALFENATYFQLRSYGGTANYKYHRYYFPFTLERRLQYIDIISHGV